MLPACALAGLLAAAAPEDAVSARWSCEPEAVEVGEPFALVLELEHPSALGARALLPEALALDASWVVLASEAPVSTAEPDGRSRTRCVWRVASLDAGERALAEVLSSVALGRA